MRAFTFAGLPVRVVFGSGTVSRLVEETEALGIKRALVISTPEQSESAEQIVTTLGDVAAGVFAGARMHTPTGVTDEAMAEVKRLGVDGLVAIGGGSTTGLSKAIAYRTDLPQVVIPTTYAGSEMTPILGQTEDGVKTTMRDAKILPETVIYDVDFTLGLPINMSGVSGMNAIAHAVEALYAKDRNPVIELMAEEGIRALGSALPKISGAPEDEDVRADALYGAWLCGICLGSTGMALHHKLCHTLGGGFDLPHAETHTVILPYVMRFNAEAAPNVAVKVSRALGTVDAARGLLELNRKLGAPKSLSEIGMPEEGIARAAKMACAKPYWNPRPVTEEDVAAILSAAWRGDDL